MAIQNPKSKIQNTKSKIQNLKVAVVGYGKVGRVMAEAFTRIGCEVLVVARPKGRAIQNPKSKIQNRISSLPTDLDFILLCVRDTQIRGLAEEIVKRGGFRKGTIVAHTAGAVSAGILAPVREVGCLALAWHPLQTFTGDEGADLLRGITFGIDGDAQAVRVGERLARALGGEPFRVPPELRPLYHLGGVFACNLMAGLVAVSQDLLAGMGMDEERSLRALAPLIRATADNIARQGLPGSITGPLKRGDVDTIAAHLKVLERHPEAWEIYRTLSRSLLRYLPAVENRRKLQTLLP